MLDDGKLIARSKAEERQRKLCRIRRKRRTQLLAIVISVLVVIVGSYKVYHSGFFNVKKSDISGNKSVSADKIINSIGISKDTNLLQVSSGKIKEKLLKNPWIKEISVRKVLPSTLKIEVVERIPIALVAHAGKFYLVDGESFVIAETQFAGENGTPTITDLPVSNIKTGKKLNNDSLENAIKCLALMDPSLRRTINLISASSVTKLSLYTKDDIEISYGEAKQAEEKNRVLLSILTRQGQKVIYIDIRDYPRSDPVLRRADAVP